MINNNIIGRNRGPQNPILLRGPWRLGPALRVDNNKLMIKHKISANSRAWRVWGLTFPPDFLLSPTSGSIFGLWDCFRIVQHCSELRAAGVTWAGKPGAANIYTANSECTRAGKLSACRVKAQRQEGDDSRSDFRCGQPLKYLKNLNECEAKVKHPVTRLKKHIVKK